MRGENFMTTSRDRILNKLRTARRPFPDAAPRPQAFQPVTVVDDTRPAALYALFAERMAAMSGQTFLVDGDEAARAKVLELLREQNVGHVLAWDFQYIPVAGLQEAVAAAGIRITFPDAHGPDRKAILDDARLAGAGIIGADAAAASTATLIVPAGPGRGRIPTVLPQMLIAVITLDQLVPHLESWLERERSAGSPTIRAAANLCFITGPSRTGDIEMQTVLGVHGPGIVRVVVKQ